MDQLPFRIGQLAESKCFLEGYRGAWFRCQIKDIAVRRGNLSYCMEYFDYPDEKVDWLKLYQKPPTMMGGFQQKKLQLMVRPSFPKSYLENEAPKPDNVSEVVVVYRGTWKVGDRVDWCYESCYWSAQITDLLGNDKVQVALLGPPLGEGGSYEALCKDLRPSLDWSPEDGWTVPKAKEENECTVPCARLVVPFKKDNEDVSHDVLHSQDADKLEEDRNKKHSCKINMMNSCSPSVKMEPLHQMVQDSLLKVEPLEHASYTKGSVEEKLLGKEGAQVRFKDGKINDDVAIPAAGKEMEMVDHEKLILPKKRVRNGNSEMPQDHKAGKPSALVGYPILHEDRREANGVPEKSFCTEDNSEFKDLSDRPAIWRKEELNLAIYPDTVESSILAIEELVNKIKWVNRVLQFGINKSSSKKASWQFLEQ
ncbi:unnamed protein product [Victoria cruziana]